MPKIYGSYTTPKGTKLNLIDLKGKAYLLAADRILWFREQVPDGVVKTQIIHHDPEKEMVIVKAEVYMPVVEGGQPMLVATAHKQESKKTFPDYIEKCETSALSRALAMAGFGTQFTGDELDEGDRLADAPITPAKKEKSSSSFRKRVTEAAKSTPVGDDL